MLVLVGVILVTTFLECRGSFLFGFTRFSNCTVLPKQCPSDNVTFYLYNSSMPDDPFILTEENMNSAPLSPRDRLVVLIHGYTGHKDYSPNMELRPVLLRQNNTVLTVDWGTLARSPCYIQAAINTNTVGNCTSLLLERLFTSGLANRNTTHVVGFSLGSHVAGAVGKYLKQKNLRLPWITGLDPALPLFDVFTSRADKRLDKSDADFVDVVHSNAGVKGKLSPMGHIDFYMNGASLQPGCYGNSSCDHVRAVEYYAESYETTRGFWGSPCFLNKAAFLLGFSTDLCIPDPTASPVLAMGPQLSHDARGNYQVLTASKSPYALGKFVLQLSSEENEVY